MKNFKNCTSCPTLKQKQIKKIKKSENSYHGITCAAASLSHTKNLGGLPTPKYTHVVPVPDTYRGVYRKGRDENLGEKYAKLVENKIKQDILGKGK